MQINQQNLIKSEVENQLLAIETITEIPLLEGIAIEALGHLKKQFLSLVYFNTCRNFNNIEIKEWGNSDLKEILTDSNQEKVTNTVIQYRQRTFNHAMQSEGGPIQTQKVRLKGQEKHHFAGEKCTDFEYTGDDSKNFCILESKNNDVIPNMTQKYGYQEITLNQLTPQLLYTLRLGPCIAILVVGIGSDGKAKKAALMHEDYSSPEFSVTDMFKNSFIDGVEGYSKINFFLIGGNGGNEYTMKRFNIHKSEISQLSKQHNDLIKLCLSTDDLDSPNDQFQWDESNVFFSSVGSSTYLWILQRKGLREEYNQKQSLEVTCVTGPELTYGKLDAYFRENILTQLTE